MFAALARAQPATGPQEDYVPAELWHAFEAHKFTWDLTDTADKRDLCVFGLIRRD